MCMQMCRCWRMRVRNSQKRCLGSESCTPRACRLEVCGSEGAGPLSTQRLAHCRAFRFARPRSKCRLNIQVTSIHSILFDHMFGALFLTLVAACSALTVYGTLERIFFSLSPCCADQFIALDSIASGAKPANSIESRSWQLAWGVHSNIYITVITAHHLGCAFLMYLAR